MRNFLGLLSSANNIIIIMETEEKKQRVRAQNWTSEEEIALIENVKERSLTLFGPIKGSGMKGKIKDIREKEWSFIADILNS